MWRLLKIKLISGGLLAVGLFVFGVSGVVQAGRLVIDVSGQARVADNILGITLTVTNQGDEPALDIQAEAPADFPVPKSLLVKRLRPGTSVELDLQAEPGGTLPGTYVKVILVNFRDARNHPYTALAEVRYDFGAGVESPVAVEGGTVALSDRRIVRIRLLNQGRESLKIKPRVFAPREFSAAQPRGVLNLEPGQPRALSFDLWNLSGLAGSIYPVMVVLEHTSQGRHAAKAARIMATVTPRQNPVRKHLEWWLAAVGAALIMFVAAQFKIGGRR